MTILSIQQLQIGVVPTANPNNTLPAAAQTPSILLIATNDTNATVTTAGYLNALQQSTTGELSFSQTQMALVYTTDQLVNWYQVQIASNGIITLAESQSSITGNLVVSGTITAGGNITAGSSGHAGSFVAFPPTPANGTLVVAASNNVNNFVSKITNSAVGQATTYTLPDPGVAAASFILNNSAGTQTIATGNLSVATGNVTAGSSGNTGVLTSFSGTALRGSLIVAAVANTGNTNTTISNVAMGQASIVSIPDPVNAVGRFLVAATATPFTANHSLVASGTGGLIADAGYQQKVVAQAAVAGGAAAQTVIDAFCTAASMVTASWNDQTNPASILTVAAGVGQFIVTSSADPGASHINYIITKV
jgi:hypothetical protein